MDVKEVIEYTIDAPRESILSWKHDDVTKKVLRIIQAEAQDYRIRLGNGETLSDNMQVDTARCIGRVEGLQFIEELLNAAFATTEEDSEDERDEEEGIAEDIRPPRVDPAERSRRVSRRNQTRLRR